jgi:predicted nucleotidyltransferase
MTGQQTPADYPAPDGPTPETSAPLRMLVAALQERFGDGLRAVILYGSCLRSGDLLDGLVDFYVLAENTPRAEPRFLLRLGGRILPPNVYYLETPLDGQTVRCKYAVLSLAQFERGTGPGWFQSYLWGRFAQPVKPVWCDTPATRARLDAAFLRAGETLLRRSVPALPPEGRLADLWQGALALSYATELRAERQGRAAELAGRGQAFFEALTWCLLPRLGALLGVEARDDGTLVYRSHATARARRTAPMLWALRRVQGKALSLARLIKGFFTFEGGLDYLAWKLSRHSGQEVVIPDKVRRRPLIHIWGFMRRLHARGVFR